MKIYVTIYRTKDKEIVKVFHTRKEAQQAWGTKIYEFDLQCYKYDVMYQQEPGGHRVTIASFSTRAEAKDWIQFRHLGHICEFQIRSVPHEPTE